MALDGRVFPLGEGPMPPRHIRCRSATTPVLKSARELGLDLPELPEATRASLDGPVPATTTYNEWPKSQPVAAQTETHGATTGKLFRQGGSSVDRTYVTKSGRGTVREKVCKYGSI